MIFHTVFTLILVRSPELTKNIVNRRTLFYIIRNYFFSRLVFRRDRPSPRGSVTPWHSFLRNPSIMPSPPFLSLSLSLSLPYPSLFFFFAFFLSFFHIKSSHTRSPFDFSIAIKLYRFHLSNSFSRAIV